MAEQMKGTRLRQDKPGASLEHGAREGSSNEGASTVIMGLVRVRRKKKPSAAGEAQPGELSTTHSVSSRRVGSQLGEPMYPSI
jgi:hypothetical protein